MIGAVRLLSDKAIYFTAHVHAVSLDVHGSACNERETSLSIPLLTLFLLYVGVVPLLFAFKLFSAAVRWLPSSLKQTVKQTAGPLRGSTSLLVSADGVRRLAYAVAATRVG